jgi:hypothetical protein
VRRLTVAAVNALDFELAARIKNTLHADYQERERERKRERIPLSHIPRDSTLHTDYQERERERLPLSHIPRDSDPETTGHIPRDSARRLPGGA